MIKKFVNIAGAKDRPRYESTLKQIARSGVCPFCPATMRWHTKPILKRYRGWLITENISVYANAQHHFLIIGRSHKENLEELASRDWNAISFLFNWAIKKFNIKGGGIAMRFGEPAYTGATVRHLHMHLISPHLKKGKAGVVSVTIG
ncbi:MAG: HIT domain-containing protein [Candidatus Sungbacteria bacterium]|uniref:HIT domain-containing protein n=1 Tax=Candidatus Sungiibacteriota bacterium TaxID=2750080 RepID=A0A932QXU5_9BACT|nr:HIT domain-containing protein [Candidatus Sungbacteria bacterium]